MTMVNNCTAGQVEDLYETPSFLWLPGVAGPKFDIDTKRVSAAIVEYESSQPFTFNYTEVHHFYCKVGRTREWGPIVHIACSRGKLHMNLAFMV